MPIAAATAPQTDRSVPTAVAVPVPFQISAATAAVVPEGIGKDALLAWFKGEFAAANAIIDALCSHLKKASVGAASDESEYEAVFAALHRRRLNWIPVLQMQKYHSIAEVAIELQKVAAKKAADLKEKKAEEVKACLEGEKVTENEPNGDVEEVEDDSPSSEITEAGSQENHQQSSQGQDMTQVCENHEECDGRSSEIKPIKGFQAKEHVKGHTVNVVKGLKLYEDILTPHELSKLTDLVSQLRASGQNGKLSGETFILFNKQMKGNKREMIQLGVPIFGHLKDELSTDDVHAVDIEPIPPLLQSVIDHLVTWKLIPEYKKPNGCIINFFEEGEYSQPFLKPPHLEQPISTLVLSESTLAFGRILSSDNEGNFRGPLTLSLKQGSLLVMRGNSADMARHVMCPSHTKRVSITLFRVRPEASQIHSLPTTLQTDGGVMTMWQPCHYPMAAPTPFLNGYEPMDLMPKLGVLGTAPMVMLAPPPLQPTVLTSPKSLATAGGGTGVFLPWAVSPRKHVKHLPPRAQKRRLLSLPASSSSSSESTSEPGISVGGGA
ncbi:PREDICTED: uncharacterized protein LOC104815949 [Tarenaya hassleriana]|uniref:uncharacterized protein LOC104815949 n=1 Tax=Tarenaya hassleriana TaxID=28532 RepID=UPI00053C18BC|nr:PREDICTED: uncharacterized protein LOC104815949 [Tarenaya hassleriana]